MATGEIRDRLLRALAAQSDGSSDFDLNPGMGPPSGAVLRPAAVLVTVMARDETVLLTKRSSALKHHPGQVAFPGGKVDEGDAGLVDAALREAHEEVGLAPSSVEVLGTLAPHQTVTGFEVTPVLAVRDAPFDAVPEAGEVEEAFFVPLAHVTDPGRFRIEGRRWRGVTRRYYAVPWGPYYIWGATARMLRGLADRLARCD
ncbi:MAG: CoA pyrophosphatase [Paracoccaceae bacterium]|nr:CoA pyrophosphatase [Paracoccaceae bacterium]